MRSLKALLGLALLALHASASCEGSQCVAEDETSLLQITQNVVLGESKANEGGATTTPAMYGTSKFGGGAKASKVKLNSAVDILLFEAACKTNIGAFFFFCFVFTFMYRNCPEVMAWRAVCGYSQAERDQKDDPKWLTSPWTLEEIDNMEQWEDGPDEEGNPTMLVPAQMFKKKNNYPAPKASRIDPEDLDMWKKEGWTAWLKASGMLGSSKLDWWNDDVCEAIGVDCAMLMVFTEIALKILGVIGLGGLILIAPMFIYGGGGAAKKDVLSWQGVGNVWYDGNTSFFEKDYIDDVQWIWYVLAIYTWFVVIFVMNTFWENFSKFLVLRKRWLKGQPPPQSTTMLVELLPMPPPPLEWPDKEEGADDDEEEDDDDETKRQYWDDDYLKAYFEKLFPDQIESAYVVRKASDLIALVDQYAEECPAGGDNLPELRAAIQEAQEDLEERKTERPGDYYACNGFITFKTTHDRDAAVFQKLNDTEGEFVLSNPPLPNDIIFADLETDNEDRFINDRFADGMVLLLFMAFMPCILFIGSISSLHTIESVPAIKKFLVSNKLEATVGGVLASLGLTIMMSMLPTFLLAIYELYTLKAIAWRQLELQRWYFWFLVMFVLLVTCVGSDLMGVIETLAHRPFGIFSLLANRMPLTTHFYLNYTIMQVLTHGMGLSRYINYLKYVLFKQIGFGRPGGGRSEDARFKSEPEDQDFYGIGSRSARFAFMLTAGLVYGTICPLMNFTVGCNFIACRTVYGYLIPCAEMRKNDIGGEHFVLQIKQVSQGLLIYIILQTGVISNRAESHLPGTLAGLSFLIWFVMYSKLDSKRWKALALSDIMIPKEKNIVMRKSLLPAYTQNLDDVYTVPYNDGKGEEVWRAHYASLP